MVEALKALPAQTTPLRGAMPGLLGGLDSVVAHCSAWFGRASGQPAA
jgi:hypothetical protein